MLIILSSSINIAWASSSLFSSQGDYWYINKSEQNGINFNGYFEYEFSIKFRSVTGAQFFYADYENAVNFTNIYINNDNHRLYFSSINDGVWGISAYINWTPVAGIWYTISIEGKGDGTATSADWKIRIDNVDKGLLTKEVGIWNPVIANHQGVIYIGQQGNNANFLNADIVETRIWGTKRTEEEKNANYNNELAGNETGLSAYWKFISDGNDYSGNENHLMFSSGAGVFSTETPITASSNPDPEPEPEPVASCPFTEVLGSDASTQDFTGSGGIESASIGLVEGVPTVCVKNLGDDSFIASLTFNATWTLSPNTPIRVGADDNNQLVVLVYTYKESTGEKKVQGKYLDGSEYCNRTLP